MPRRKSLNKAVVSSLKHSGETQSAERHYDGDGSGLWVNVWPSGSKSWVQCIRVHGRRRYLGLGPYPAITLKRARELALENKHMATEGVDPISERQHTQQLLCDHQIPATPHGFRSSSEIDPSGDISTNERRYPRRAQRFRGSPQEKHRWGHRKEGRRGALHPKHPLDELGLECRDVGPELSGQAQSRCGTGGVAGPLESAGGLAARNDLTMAMCS